jgi:two-component system response regulator RstA
VERSVREQPDLVVLDVMLPGVDGLTICRTVRDRYGGPILMLTARGDDIDQVLGFELGADDYVAKPAAPRVLLARISALLRRATAQAPASQRLSFGDLVVDARTREVHRAGVELPLTTAEFDLLWLLASRAGEVLSRQTILDALRGINYDGLDRSIDVRISKLRQHIGDNPRTPTRIKTVRGTGYLFAPDKP